MKKQQSKKYKKKRSFKPVSFSLINEFDILLTKEKSYNICFSSGITNGKRITINKEGNEITFHTSGFFRFEMIGSFSLNSETDKVKLIFKSDKFDSEVKAFTQLDVLSKNKLEGLVTVIPIEKHQKLIPCLVSSQGDKIILMNNSKLFISRIC